jgi:hypothetical protein
MGQAEEDVKMEVLELQYDSVLKENFRDAQVPKTCTQFPAPFFNWPILYIRTYMRNK